MTEAEIESWLREEAENQEAVAPGTQFVWEHLQRVAVVAAKLAAEYQNAGR